MIPLLEVVVDAFSIDTAGIDLTNEIGACHA
jgi:hypothetical protein